MTFSGTVTTFTMRVETQWGDTACLVGSSAELGAWNPQHGSRMMTDSSTYPQWRAEVVLRGAEGVEYKVCWPPPAGP